MAAIPNTSHDMVDAIYASLKKRLTSKFRLTRVGASGIGNPCLRAVWYDWRGYTNKQHDGRMLRLFQTGHQQEDRIVGDLKEAGFQVWEIDQLTGQQWTYTDVSGHFVCKLDGVMKGVIGAEKTAHVLEIKTHNKKSFDSVVKDGVQKAKPYHYDQMHCGMMLSGINRALYVALCKDNEAYYVERIVFDPDHAAKIGDKVARVISATMPPAKLAGKPDGFECKFCDHKKVCWEGETPFRTCRSCQHAEAVQGGEWACGLTNDVLTPDFQLRTCEHYEVLG